MIPGINTPDDPQAGRLLQALAARAAPGLVEEAFTAARAEAKAILQREFVRHLLHESGAISDSAVLDVTDPLDDGEQGSSDRQGQHSNRPGQPLERPGQPPDRQAQPPERHGQHSNRPARTPERQAEPSMCARPHGSPSRRADRGTPDPRRGSCYLYGITDAAPSCVHGLAGVDNSTTEAIVDDGLVAVVSPIDGDSATWRALAEEAPDLATLAPLLRAHEGVLEDLLDAGPVVPVRFGLTFADPRDVSGLLRSNKPAIRAALDRVRGKAEWGLTIAWDVNLVRLRLDRLDGLDGSETAAASGTEVSAGRRYLEQRRADRRSAGRLDSLRGRMAATLHGRLAELSSAAVAHRPDVHARRAEGQSALEPLLKGSYLVAHEQAQPFRSAIERELDAGREWALTGELTGPWPPYHFVALNAAELPS